MMSSGTANNNASKMVVDDNDKTTIKLKSMPNANGECETFELSLKAASISDLVTDAVGDNDDDDDDDNNEEGKGRVVEIDVARVPGPCLAKVVDFMRYYDKEKLEEWPKLLGEAKKVNDIVNQKWYQDFVGDEALGGPENYDMLFDLTTAGNFMGISPLLDLTCLAFTFRIAGKDREQIRQIFDWPELTPEEEAIGREEHPWIFED